MCGDPLDGVLFLPFGGYRPDGADLSLDVSHIWAGGAFSAVVPCLSAVLPSVAKGRGVCLCHFCGGIRHRLAFAMDDGCLSLGLRRDPLFCYGADPSGLCAPLGDFRIIFRTGGFVSDGERMGERIICSLWIFGVE